MKILIILLRLRGGVGRANKEIAEVLRKKGHKVDILSREDDLKKYSLIKGIFPVRNRIKRLMKEKNYDIIYTQDYSVAPSLLFPYPLFWKKHFSCFCGVKPGNHPRLIQWHHKFIHRLTGKIMGKKLVVIGDELKKIFPKATLIYRGVNLKKFKPLRKKRSFLGWIFTDNETISLQEIKKIGDRVNLKLLVAKDIPEDKMNDFYNKCKVFVNLPRTAGFNLAWLEAMAAGVPIIVGNYEGAGTFLPINKVSNNQNREEKMISMIKNPKNMNYRKWLMDNGFIWKNKARDLSILFEEGRKNV